jgi:hypothetical protein
MQAGESFSRMARLRALRGEVFRAWAFRAWADRVLAFGEDAGMAAINIRT